MNPELQTLRISSVPWKSVQNSLFYVISTVQNMFHPEHPTLEFHGILISDPQKPRLARTITYREHSVQITSRELDLLLALSPNELVPPSIIFLKFCLNDDYRELLNLRCNEIHTTRYKKLKSSYFSMLDLYTNWFEDVENRKFRLAIVKQYLDGIHPNYVNNICVNIYNLNQKLSQIGGICILDNRPHGYQLTFTSP